MKQFFLLSAVALLAIFTSCKKDSGGLGGGVSCDLPSTSAPGDIAGDWANGYNSSTDIVDAYNGEVLGNNWQSGKVFHFPPDGKNAEFYITASAGLSMKTATKAIGTVEFLNDNSFIFHACKAHYKGWQNGNLTVDRDATASEVSGEGLTQKYYYSFDNSGSTTWMVIKFDPDSEYGTSFEKVQ